MLAISLVVTVFLVNCGVSGQYCKENVCVSKWVQIPYTYTFLATHNNVTRMYHGVKFHEGSSPRITKRTVCCPGYTRESQDECKPVCDPACKHGQICFAPNKCSCRYGYSLNYLGECEPVCINPCGNGTCTAPDVCECAPGYKFDKIYFPMCRPYRNNECECGDGPNKCECKNSSTDSSSTLESSTSSSSTPESAASYSSTSENSTPFTFTLESLLSFTDSSSISESSISPSSTSESSTSSSSTPESSAPVSAASYSSASENSTPVTSTSESLSSSTDSSSTSESSIRPSSTSESLPSSSASIRYDSVSVAVETSEPWWCGEAKVFIKDLGQHMRERGCDL